MTLLKPSLEYKNVWTISYLLLIICNLTDVISERKKPQTVGLNKVTFYFRYFCERAKTSNRMYFFIFLTVNRPGFRLGIAFVMLWFINNFGIWKYNSAVAYASRRDTRQIFNTPTQRTRCPDRIFSYFL